MASYGETGTGALDHLPSRVAGHRQSAKRQKLRQPSEDQSPARKWDDKRKMFVYPD